MPTRARVAMRFRPLPSADAVQVRVEDGNGDAAAADVTLAQGLVDVCRHPSNEHGVSAMRASCLAVHMARRLLWSSELMDIVHLASLGRLDLPANRARWANCSVPALRLAARQCDENEELPALIRLAVLAERLVREEGIYHGIDSLMRTQAPEEFLDAAWDLRYDQTTWVRLDQRPHHEVLIHAGRIGLSGIKQDQLPEIPLPVLDQRAAA